MGLPLPAIVQRDVYLPIAQQQPLLLLQPQLPQPQLLPEPEPEPQQQHRTMMMSTIHRQPPPKPLLQPIMSTS